MDFDAYLDRELPALSRFVGVLVGNPHDAHDILADALIVVAARWERITVMAHPTAYVRRVIVSTFLSERRTSARRRTAPVGDDEVLDRPVDDPSEAVLIRAETDRLLSGLPPRHRAAVVLRYYRGSSSSGDWRRTPGLTLRTGTRSRSRCVPAGTAEGGEMDDYAAGFRAAGVQDLRTGLLDGSARFSSAEAPGQVWSAIAKFTAGSDAIWRDQSRAAQSRPRSMIVRTCGCRNVPRSWPGVATKTRPSPHCRVHTAGEVTSRCQGSPGRARWVVVASTSLWSSVRTHYCSVVSTKSGTRR